MRKDRGLAGIRQSPSLFMDISPSFGAIPAPRLRFLLLAAAGSIGAVND
jgi:hypothetical protein